MISIILYRLGEFLALALGRRGGYALAVFICRLQFIFSGRDRRSVVYNVERVLSGRPRREVLSVSRQIFENFGKYLVDFFRFSKLDDAFIKKYIKIKDIHHLDDALKNYPGVIVLTAHIGNWELGGALIARLGYPFNVIALPHKHPKVNAFFNRKRSLFGAHVIEIGMALKTCFSLLKTKKIVAFLGDRDFQGFGVDTLFCGKPASVPSGPARFSLKTRAAIVPGFMVREKDDSFSLVFEGPILPYNEDGSPRSESEIRDECVRTIERYVLTYPSQWYMFQPFFKE